MAERSKTWKGPRVCGFGEGEEEDIAAKERPLGRNTASRGTRAAVKAMISS